MARACASTSKTIVPVKINGISAQVLTDSSSTNSHVSESVVQRLKLDITKQKQWIGLAVKGHASSSVGTCEVAIEFNEQRYDEVCLSVLRELLTNVVLS